MGRNYRRAYRPEYNEPTKNLHRRAAHKKTPTPTVNTQGKYRNLTNLKKKNPSRTYKQPTAHE